MPDPNEKPRYVIPLSEIQKLLYLDSSPEERPAKEIAQNVVGLASRMKQAVILDESQEGCSGDALRQIGVPDEIAQEWDKASKKGRVCFLNSWANGGETMMQATSYFARVMERAGVPLRKRALEALMYSNQETSCIYQWLGAAQDAGLEPDEKIYSTIPMDTIRELKKGTPKRKKKYKKLEAAKSWLWGEK